MLILGIDPGSRVTGFGLVEMSAAQSARYVASGCVRVIGADLAERLGVIFTEVGRLVREYGPQELAIEKVFVHRNADSALKLGHARGAAICAAVTGALRVAEYTPRQIKQAVVGHGNADKEQVQHMVRVLLALPAAPQADAADALAVALCHGHTRASLARIPGAEGARGGRLR